MLPMLVEMKIRFVTSKSLYKYKLFPVDDRAAHTSVVQIKSWEFTWGWVLHLAEGKGVEQQPDSTEVSQETTNQKVKATPLSGPMTGSLKLHLRVSERRKTDTLPRRFQLMLEAATVHVCRGRKLSHKVVYKYHRALDCEGAAGM